MFGSQPAKVPQSTTEKDGNRSIGWGNITQLWFNDEAEAPAANGESAKATTAKTAPAGATPQGLGKISQVLGPLLRAFSK